MFISSEMKPQAFRIWRLFLCKINNNTLGILKFLLLLNLFCSLIMITFKFLNCLLTFIGIYPDCNLFLVIIFEQRNRSVSFSKFKGTKISAMIYFFLIIEKILVVTEKAGVRSGVLKLPLVLNIFCGYCFIMLLRLMSISII